jgi:hypothetical protein
MTLRRGAERETIVEFGVTNSGDARGELGASLNGNFVSGTERLTATAEPGAKRTVTGMTRVVGRGDAAEIRLDWGLD